MKHKAYILDVNKLVLECQRRYQITILKKNVPNYMFFCPKSGKSGYYYDEITTLKYKMLLGI